MHPDFHIDFVTHDEYEYLVAEIRFRGQRLCQLFRRAEDNEIEIEFIEDRLILQSPVRLRFAFDAFVKVTEQARRELLALKR